MRTAAVTAHRLAELVTPLVSTSAGGPRYRRLAEAIRTLIVDGRLLPSWRLPSERSLAAATGHSRNTVSHAYDVLREWSCLESVRGSGSLVRLPTGAPGMPGSQRPAAGHDRYGSGATDGPGRIDLTRACPEAAPEVAQAYRHALAQISPYLQTSGYESAGLPVLREAIARRYAQRGLPTHPEQIVVTNGALAGIAILGRAFIGVGDRVLVETPGYPTSVAALRRFGARLVGVAVGECGVDPDDVASAVRQTAPRLALLTPDFQNPTGALTPADRRVAIGAVLARERVITVIDETLAEVVLEGPPAGMPPPYAACTPSDADVVTVGSMSKSHWGGLRVGWLRVPARQLSAVSAARTTLDLGVPLLEQLTATWLLDQEPGLSAPMARLTRGRRDALSSALARHCPDWSFRLPAGGLSLWCRLPIGAAGSLAAAAEADGILIAPGPVFSTEGLGLQRYVRLPYTLPQDRLVEAAGRLAMAWARVARPTADRLAVPVIT